MHGLVLQLFFCTMLTGIYGHVLAHVMWHNLHYFSTVAGRKQKNCTGLSLIISNKWGVCCTELTDTVCFISLFLSSLYLPHSIMYHVLLLTISSYIPFTCCMFIGAGVVYNLCFIFSGTAFTLIGSSVFLSVRHRLDFVWKSWGMQSPFCVCVCILIP